MSYLITDIKNMISQLDEDRTKEILSSFSCPINPDIEYFLKNSSIDFSNQGIAATHLIFILRENRASLVGYFTLVNKTLPIPKEQLSKTLEKN